MGAHLSFGVALRRARALNREPAWFLADAGSPRGFAAALGDVQLVCGASRDPAAIGSRTAADIAQCLHRGREFEATVQRSDRATRRQCRPRVPSSAVGGEQFAYPRHVGRVAEIGPLVCHRCARSPGHTAFERTIWPWPAHFGAGAPRPARALGSAGARGRRSATTAHGRGRRSRRPRHAKAAGLQHPRDCLPPCW